MNKVDRTVVRNQPYQREGIPIRERHNERRNKCYKNPDIILDRSPLNIHFKQCADTYFKTLDKMLKEKTVSARGLKKDAKVFGELVFDVNTSYFENHGGYEYAKEFFQEVYYFAEKEVGSEYILSAVMHADERNKGLSDQLKKDVFHYHLHVVYIPVVQKEVKWSKRCKDKELVGKTKEVINQISHSKKWAFVPEKDEHGNPVLKNDGKPKMQSSYSLLQDRFFNHMKQAGYYDLERGVRGSTAEHLTVLDYKIQQDKKQLEQTKQHIKQEELELQKLQQKVESIQPVAASVEEVDTMGKQKRFGNKIELTQAEYTKLTELAKSGITSKHKLAEVKAECDYWFQEFREVDRQLTDLVETAKDYFKALKLAPQRVKELFQDIFSQEQRKEESQKKTQKWKLSKPEPIREQLQELSKPKPTKPPRKKTRKHDRDSR